MKTSMSRFVRLHPTTDVLLINKLTFGIQFDIKNIQVEFLYGFDSFGRFGMIHIYIKTDLCRLQPSY